LAGCDAGRLPGRALVPAAAATAPAVAAARRRRPFAAVCRSAGHQLLRRPGSLERAAPRTGLQRVILPECYEVPTVVAVCEPDGGRGVAAAELAGNRIRAPRPVAAHVWAGAVFLLPAAPVA